MTLQSSVKEMNVVKPRGPWTTKSNASLEVLFSMPSSAVRNFFLPSENIKSASGAPLMGLRSYMVSDIPNGSVGAGEWHKYRNELLICMSGRLEIEVQDTSGASKRFILSPKESLHIHPLTLHTYTSLQNGTSLQVIANTLFDPDDESTHDTYSKEEFLKLEKDM